MWEKTGDLLEPMANITRIIQVHLEEILAKFPLVPRMALTKGLNSLF